MTTRAKTVAKNKRKAMVISEDQAWRAESDLHTYLQWCEIQKDSKRMEAMKKLASEKLGDYARAAAAVGKIGVDIDD